jgi:hypothetical protein
MGPLNSNEQQCYEDMHLILQSSGEIYFARLADFMRDKNKSEQYFYPDIARMLSIINSKGPQGLSEGEPTYTDFVIAQIRLLTRAHKVPNVKIKNLCDSFFRNMSTPWFAVAKKSITFASFALIFLPAEVFAAIDASPIELSETAKSLASCRVDIPKYPPQFIRMEREYLQKLFISGVDYSDQVCIATGITKLGEQYSIYCDGLFEAVDRDDVAIRIAQSMNVETESSVVVEASSLVSGQDGLFAAKKINIGDLIWFRGTELGPPARLRADDVELPVCADGLAGPAYLQFYPDEEGAAWRNMNHDYYPTHLIAIVVISGTDDQACTVRLAFIAMEKSPPGAELYLFYSLGSYLNIWDQQVVSRLTLKKLKSINNYLRPSYIADCRSTAQLPLPGRLQPTHADHLLLTNPIFCLYLFIKDIISLEIFKQSIQDNACTQGINPVLYWLCIIIEDDKLWWFSEIKAKLIENNFAYLVDAIPQDQAGKTLEAAYSMIYHLFGEHIDNEVYTFLEPCIERYKQIDLEKNPEKSKSIEKHYQQINAVYKSKTIDRRQVVDIVCSALMQRESATSVDQWLHSAHGLQQHAENLVWMRSEIMSRLTIFAPKPACAAARSSKYRFPTSAFARAIGR